MWPSMSPFMFLFVAATALCAQSVSFHVGSCLKLTVSSFHVWILMFALALPFMPCFPKFVSFHVSLPVLWVCSIGMHDSWVKLNN